VIRGAGVGTGTLALKDRKTFKEDMEFALTSLADVKELINRMKSLAELRAKDGRGLSEEKRKELEALKTLLDEVGENCQTVIDKTEKDCKAVEQLHAQYQRILFEQKHLIEV
jgi:uncharacterized membrane protein